MKVYPILSVVFYFLRKKSYGVPQLISCMSGRGWNIHAAPPSRGMVGKISVY